MAELPPLHPQLSQDKCCREGPLFLMNNKTKKTYFYHFEAIQNGENAVSHYLHRSLQMNNSLHK
jgi:hypothetical protein